MKAAGVNETPNQCENNRILAHRNSTSRSCSRPANYWPAACETRTGNEKATSPPGAWTGWSTKYNWVSRRRAAFVEFTVRECQDAIQIGLVQIRKRLIDAANELLDDGGVPAVRAASRVIVENFPPVARVADVSDGEQFEDLSDIPDADIARMKEIRDAARQKNKLYRLRVLGQWFDGIRFYAAASSPRRSRRTWAGLR